MKSGDITVTNKRVLDALRNTTAKSVGVSPDTLSKNVASTLQLIKCRVLRVYNTRQEVYVQIISNKKKVKAKILNPFLSEQVNISFTIDGIIHNDEKGYYIEPYEKLYGCIMEFKDKSTKGNDYCFLGFMDVNTTALNSNSVKGEILIKVENNYISITEERVNIKAENLFINGLPYDSPHLKNYYTKKEVDKLIHELDPTLNVKEVLG